MTETMRNLRLPLVAFAGLCAAALLFSGCTTARHGDPQKWKLPAGATVNVVAHPAATILSSLFSGVELDNPAHGRKAAKVSGFVSLDAKTAAKPLQIEAKGRFDLAKGARARCRLSWNGHEVGSRMLTEKSLAENGSGYWTVDAVIQPDQLRSDVPNHVGIRIELTGGGEPAHDFLSLDSLDLNAEVVQHPAGSSQARRAGR